MQPRRHRKRRYAASVGGAFVLLAAIGVITVIVACLRLTVTVLDNSGEKERFAEFVRPVMMFDPVPFEQPQDIEMNNLLLYSMWSTLMSERAQNYTYNENQALMVPASDLDVAATNLFGSGVTLEHQTFGDYESSYAYDSATNTYNVRVSAALYVYRPEVREITKDGDLYRLDVYYIPPDNAWNLTPAGERLTPFIEKHMLFYLSKDGNSYHLAKVQIPPTEAQESQTSQESPASAQ